MSNRLLTDDTGAEILKAIKQQNAVIARGSSGLKPSSYDDVLRIVRMGLAREVFDIGDVIEVARETAVQASLGSHTGITGVTVDEDTFVAAMDEAGEKEYEIIFDGSAWRYEDKPIILADYGIAVTGTAAKDDTIIVIETASTINMVVMDFIEGGQAPAGAIKLHDKTKEFGVILQSEKILYTLQYDQREAFYHASSGLPAGTYNVTIGAHRWVEGDIGKTFQFTLTAPVPEGGQLYFQGAYNAALNGTQVSVFADNTATVASENATLSEGSGGTSLGTLAYPVDGDLNSIDRALMGSNRWSTSAIRQHLNSAATKGNVWTPKTVFDRPPVWLTNTAGFMHGLDPEFIKICADVELITGLSTTAGDASAADASAGTGNETTVDKFFFPSTVEVFGNKDNNSFFGDPWEFYRVNSDAPIGSYNNAEDTNRIKTNSAGTPGYWWHRNPIPGIGYYVRIVFPAGSVGYSNATSALGVVPACIIA